MIVRRLCIPDEKDAAYMTSRQPVPDERRVAQRTAVTNESRLVQRTHLSVPGQSRQHKCRITDTSATGYRVVLLSPNPDAGRQFSQGQELVLEHVDGWNRVVSVRWVKGNQIGLKILNPVTRVILPDEQGVPQPYDCTLLAGCGNRRSYWPVFARHGLPLLH